MTPADNDNHSNRKEREERRMKKLNNYKKAALRAEVLEAIARALDEEIECEWSRSVSYNGLYGTTTEEEYIANYHDGEDGYELSEYERNEISENAYKKEVVREVLKALEKML